MGCTGAVWLRLTVNHRFLKEGRDEKGREGKVISSQVENGRQVRAGRCGWAGGLQVGTGGCLVEAWDGRRRATSP